MSTFARCFAYATAVFCLLACAAATRDLGPDATTPAYRVGDRWVYEAEDGFRQRSTWVEIHEIIGVGPDRITVRITQQGAAIDSVRTEHWSAPGQVMVGAAYDNETRRFAMPLQRYNFPLAPGQIWNQWVDNVNETAKTEGAINRYVVVDGWESVTTPAGTFNAIRLRVLMRLDDGQFWRWPTTCDDLVWYAPAVRAVVRSQLNAGYIERGGPDAASVWTQHAVLELREFRPGA